MKNYEERVASVQQKLRQKQTRRKVLMATSGALCLCIIAGIFLWPFDNIERYKDNDYYQVIKAIKRDFPVYKGNLWYGDIVDRDVFEENVTEDTAFPLSPGATPDTDLSNGTNSSVEITDHQVAGVHEADLIKRSQTHIFYLNDGTLEVYPIAGEETKLLTTWKIPSEYTTKYRNLEMYLSADATRLTLLMSGYGELFGDERRVNFARVISLDVSDPTNIQEVGNFYITGNIISSRMVEGQLMLVSQFRMDSKINFDDQTTFLPQVGTPGNMQSIPADNIVIPEKLNDRCYTVVTLLDSEDVSLVDCGAFMSYSTEIYVSKEHIYASRNYWIEEEHSDDNATTTVNEVVTELSCMAYGEDGLSNKGTFRVDGTVDNQYNMDEHEGVFRIVTETNERMHTVYKDGSKSISMPRKQNANLTCFQVGTWEKIAEVKDFAPEGETVESVRFDGDYAYVCTAVVINLTDPVFFFDMTDLDNIIVKDTGTIDGFSSSLIQLNNGFLMGIGRDEFWNLKVEIYEETETGVASVCTFTDCVDFPSEYKAYYIDRENNIFGIPTSKGYILMQFTGYELYEVANVKCAGALENVRGVVIDNCLYVFSQEFNVESLA